MWYNEFVHPRPYFLVEVTNGNLQTCTVTSARYLDMLTHYTILELQRQNALSKVVWMQDSAPLHAGSSVKYLLNERFPDRVILRTFSFPGHQGLLLFRQCTSGSGDM